MRSVLRLLAVIAPKARRRAPGRSYWGQGDKDDRDSRFTPHEFMGPIYDALGKSTSTPAPTSQARSSRDVVSS